jgi:hypothetical protein
MSATERARGMGWSIDPGSARRAGANDKLANENNERAGVSVRVVEDLPGSRTTEGLVESYLSGPGLSKEERGRIWEALNLRR